VEITGSSIIWFIKNIQTKFRKSSINKFTLYYFKNILKVNADYVNIFEYVKNAKVTGNASPNKTIKISTTIFIDQNRIFECSQSTTSDSKSNYEFIVPYSTDGSIPGYSIQ